MTDSLILVLRLKHKDIASDISSSILQNFLINYFSLYEYANKQHIFPLKFSRVAILSGVCDKKSKIKYLFFP